MIRLAVKAILLVAVVGGWYLLLPPPARQLETGGGPLPTVRGVVHVHTRRSDGTGTVDQVAAAAARAGLQFVVLTDHGDAARDPERPVYRSGVLCIDAVEISTDGGHLVALGLPRSPYPLAGEARDVVEDVRRMGGMAIPAHPGSMKPELRWTDWTAPFDGIEWLNGDSEWRDEPPSRLARVLLTYPGRAAASLATLLDRPDEVLRRWDALTRRRRIVAIAGSDAHARLGLRRSGDVYENTASLPLPAYEQVFRAFSLALPQLRLTGNATADAAALIEEIRAGHVYSSVDSFAAPAQLAFTAATATSRANAGDLLQPTGPVTLRVDTNAPADAEIRLLKDGELMASARGQRLERMVPADPAVYRVEVELATPSGQAAMPWMLSNPIYLRAPGPEPVAPGRAPARSFVVQYEDGKPRDWVVENSPRSSGAIDVALAVPGTQLLMRYAVGGSVSESPFVAFAMPAGDALATADRLMFTAHADRPMRLSVQLRIPSGVEGERWQRSIYLDQMPRDVTVFFDDMIPRGPTTARRPTLADVRSVLFVVDSVNSKPGTSGQFWIDDVRYGK